MAAVAPPMSVHVVPPFVDCCHWRATVSPAAPVHWPSTAVRTSGVETAGDRAAVIDGRTRTVSSASPYVTVGLDAVITTGRREIVTAPLT